MKMQRIKLLVVITLIITLASCKKEGKSTSNTFSIIGSVKNLDNGVLTLNYTKNKEWVEEPIQVTDGKFSHQGTVDYPQVVFIDSENSQSYPSAFFLDNSNITLEFDPKESNLIVKGSALHDEYLAFKASTDDAFSKKYEALYLAFEDVKDDAERDSIDNAIERLSEQRKAIIEAYIIDNPDSFIAASAIVDTYGIEPDVEELEGIYNRLSPRIKASGIGNKIAKTLEIAKITAVGNPAIDLTVNSVEDKPITLSDLKGKYVLLEFWASWCTPCRAENPEIKKAYAIYKEKGFEIYAVSLDVNKSEWENAIKEDGLEWLHVSDLKNSNAAANTYGVEAIPMNFLIDKEGKIIEKGLSGAELIKKLKTIL